MNPARYQTPDPYPDGTRLRGGRNEVVGQRIFVPTRSPAGLKRTCVPFSGVVLDRQTGLIHLRKTIFQDKRYADEQNTGAIFNVEPEGILSDHSVYTDLTSMVVETSAAQVYRHRGKPYRCAIAAWSVYFGLDHPLNQSHTLPPSHCNLHQEKDNKSFLQGRVQSQYRAEIWAIVRALAGLHKYYRVANQVNRVGCVRPRQFIVTTRSQRVQKILGGEIWQWRDPQWRKDNWGNKATEKPGYWRLFVIMHNWLQRMEEAGMIVQFWLVGRAEEAGTAKEMALTGMAKDMADDAVRVQATYVKALYTAMLRFCEFAAMELGYISKPPGRRTRKRRSDWMDEE